MTIVQEPNTSLADDVNTTQRVLDEQTGPVVLVGHSYAGSVITQAGTDPKVSALVYVAALQPAVGEASGQLLQKFAAPNNAMAANSNQATGESQPRGLRLTAERSRSRDRGGCRQVSDEPIIVRGRTYFALSRHAEYVRPTGGAQTPEHAMATVLTPNPPVPQRYYPRHARLVRLTHWITAFCFMLLLMSGLQVFNAHPALYVGNSSDFGHPLLSLHPFPSWITLPSYQDLATGRRWHFFFAWALVVNGLVYLIWGFASSHFRRDLLPRRVRPEARFVVFHCADTLDDGSGADPESIRYYESIDLIDAAHPQTILAYDMNGKPLTVPHGAPRRLRLERQLGYKMAKYVMRIELVRGFTHLHCGRGGYWKDRGYEWYAGI